jgi:hypothetical protein
LTSANTFARDSTACSSTAAFTPISQRYWPDLA